MKILMTLMGLEIGGAETHVVELSKALKEKGYDITVASNGGVYQAELEAHGIRHVKIPLHSKKPWLFFESYYKLKKLFEQEDFDIVHAHARIPAFICGLLAKKYTFRFVTTAHWVFKITPLWKKLANWGEKTIAVSEDIKEYLINNYSSYPDNISTTINGIDTNKFSKDTDWSDIKEEFDLSEDKYRILYVSRMDADRSAVAYMVAEAMPEILKIRANAELVIVGDGNDFSRLKSHVDKINKKIGRRAIILTGSRIDINKFVAASDVFVGVSRSALEAMASGIPVVIAGNEGYIGIFDESKFDISYKTNYCCRGCVNASTELITRDLLKIINMSPEDIEKISNYNKEVIYIHYSANKMANDYIAMYDTLIPVRHYKNGNIIINGYYGYKNMGDEALLQAIIENIKKDSENAKITVLSAAPQETSYRYSVNCIYRYNILKIIREMKKASLFISGGGSLLQDVTSTKSLLYYNSMISLAKKFGLKVMIYANGFGPIIKDKNLTRVKKSISKTDYISMREPASAKVLSKMLPNVDIAITADPAFSLSGVSKERKERLLLNHNFDCNKKYFAISLREWQYNDPLTVEKIAEYCNEINKRFSLVPVFISMQDSKDLPICEKVSKLLDCESITIKQTTAKELISIISTMTFTVGMRLHFLIFSMIAKIPCLSLSYDPKINSLIEYMELTAPTASKSINVEELLNMTDRIISNRPEISKLLDAKIEEMRELNKVDTRAIFKIIEQ